MEEDVVVGRTGQDGGRALWPPEGGSLARIEADNAHGSSRAPSTRLERSEAEKRRRGGKGRAGDL